MTIQLDPQVLRRFRTNRNISLEKLAQDSHVSVESLREYEQTTTEVELKDVEKLAKVMRMSWLAFLDDELEPERVFDHDNRTQAHQKELLDVEIQKIMEDVEFLLDVSNEIAPESSFNLSGFAADVEKPEHTAKKLRKFLGITDSSMDDIDGEYAVWNYWKDVFSSRGLYIFERSWSIQTVRAFSMTRGKKAAAVVSTKDVPLGRVFSLMHEVFHLLNREDSICDFHIGSQSSDIEVLCNRFAAAFLMPEDLFRTEAENMGLNSQAKDMVDDDQVKKLQRRFKVSRLSAYRRLYTLGFISVAKYEAIQAQYNGFEKPPKKSTGGGGDIYYRTRLNSVGKKYASEMFTAFANEKITAINLANILRVRVSQLPTINNLMGGTGKGG